MSNYQIIVGILLFAVVTAVLYVWGLKKSYMQQTDLNRILVSKCSKKILRYLSKHDSVNERKIINIIDGTKANLFWSKNKLRVTDAKKFSKEIINFMIDNKYIVKNGNEYTINK